MLAAPFLTAPKAVPLAPFLTAPLNRAQETSVPFVQSSTRRLMGAATNLKVGGAMVFVRAILTNSGHHATL